jgi:L-asparaginase II
MATAIARFATPDELPGAKAAAARRLTRAVLAWPEMIAGAGRFDTRLVAAGKGRILAKEGAEGVEVVGILGERLGIAVKIADGASRAVHAVVCALLLDLGLLAAADAQGLSPPQVLTREGNPVGDVKVRL